MRLLCLFIGTALSISYGLPDSKKRIPVNDPCTYQLLDTTFQQAVMRKNRIPDAHEWEWYGVEMPWTEKRRLVQWFAIIIQGNEHEIHDLFGFMGKEPHEMNKEMRFYRHPTYVEMVRWLLDTYVQHPNAFIRPSDRDVEVAYGNFIETAEQRYNIGFDGILNIKGICQAAADAAGYFFWRNSFPRVKKFLKVMDQYDCREKRYPKDFTTFETGAPQPLTAAIKEMDKYGFLPKDYQ